MDETTFHLLIIFLAYLAGSIPFGLLIGKQMGVDVRRTGSGNIGATNVLRSTGKLGGALTLAGDSLKGFIPVLLAKYFWGLDPPVLWVGFAAVVGHNFPVFLKFRGGKGVATSFGVLFALWPYIGAIILVLWLLVIKISSYSSLSALIAFGILPFVVWGIDQSSSALSFSLAITGLLFFRHSANIRRLCRGEEAKIGSQKL
jgi:glycerol-3-phosphate acyltransferase PlsY